MSVSCHGAHKQRREAWIASFSVRLPLFSKGEGGSTGRSGRQKAATRRNMRREERVTVQGPVKKETTTRRNVTRGGRDAIEGKGPQRRPRRRLDRRLEEVDGWRWLLSVTNAMPAFAVRGTVAGRRLGAVEGGGVDIPHPSNASLGGGGVLSFPGSGPECVYPSLSRHYLPYSSGGNA